MNAGLQAFAAYRETNAATAIMDASPHQLTSLLLKAAMERLSVAKGAMERGDVASRTAAIRKVTDIILELKNTLNLEKGADVALQLDRLYEFSITTLLEANIQKDIDKLESVRSVLAEINEAWAQIAPARGDG